MHERRKSKYNQRRAKPREQQPVSISYNNEYNPLTVGIGKKNRLNKILARVTRQTESSGRKNTRGLSDDMYGYPQHTKAQPQKPYSASKATKKPTYVLPHPLGSLNQPSKPAPRSQPRSTQGRNPNLVQNPKTGSKRI